MLLGGGQAGIVEGQPDPVPRSSGQPVAESLDVFRVIPCLDAQPDIDPSPIDPLQSFALREIRIEIALGQPGRLHVADTILHVLEKNDLSQAFGDGGADVIFHFAAGVMAEPGMDVSVAGNVDGGRGNGHGPFTGGNAGYSGGGGFGRAVAGQAFPFGKKCTTPSIAEVSQICPISSPRSI